MFSKEEAEGINRFFKKTFVTSNKEGRNLKAEFPSLFECSECGWECWDTMPCDTETFNFCPNCGVKMTRTDL